MAKVTHLKPVSGKPPVEALPRPIEKVRQRCVSLAVSYLEDMLDGVDDAFYEIARKEAESERERFFEAMRELRIQRAGLVSGFRQAVEHNFQRLCGYEPSASFASTPVDLDSLSLVNEDELETSVALDNMARRARNGCDEQLRALSHRLQYLLESKIEVGEANNPLEPRLLMECFSQGLDRLAIDIKAHLVVLKIFEQEVMAEAGYLVSEANKVLMDAGVLPDMKTAPIPPARKPGSRSLSESKADASGLPADGGGSAALGNDQMFGLLQELLVTMRSLQGSVAASGVGSAHMAVMQNGVPYMNGVPLADASSVRQVSSEDLLRVLDRLQRVERSLEKDEATPASLKTDLSELLDETHGEAIHALHQADDDVINLVSMLFDFILDDDGLPADIQALIGRLQIPLLKVALTDPHFFSNEQHEARLLLNMLARAGSQWDPQQGIQDELYQRINQAVHRVIDGYRDDASLFATLLQEFQQYFDNQQSRSERVEQRVREAEEGKARAEQARQAVSQILEKRLAGRALPDVVVQLLRQGWQQVLYLSWLREGEGSEQWQQLVKVVDAVVWSALPHRDPVALEKLKTLSPRLLKSLHAGLAAISYDELESRQWLEALHGVHRQLLQGLEMERVAVEQPPQPQAEVVKPEQGGLPEDHFLIKKASQLAPGQWIEIVTDNEVRRAKLAANIRHGDKLVFTNRRGIKVEEFSAYDLAVALHQGAAKLIDEGALFDRALESVISDLRRVQSSANH